MGGALRLVLRPVQGPASILLIRIAVGLIFFTQGILKYTDPTMGVVRFTRIGFPHPYFTAHFVGAFEIACGLLVLLGLWTSVPERKRWTTLRLRRFAPRRRSSVYRSRSKVRIFKGPNIELRLIFSYNQPLPAQHP